MAIIAELAAVIGPIVLGLMGVAVTVWLPTKPLHHWIWGIAFVVVGIVAVGGSLKQLRDSDKTNTEQTQALKDLRRAVENLTKPVPAPAPSTPAKDPDTLYQGGQNAGQVIAPREAINQSKIYFSMIVNAGSLDPNKQFNYREFTLKIVSVGSRIGMLVMTPGGVYTNVYRDVVCEITGRIGN